MAYDISNVQLVGLNDYDEPESPCDGGIYYPKNAFAEIAELIVGHDQVARGLERLATLAANDDFVDEALRPMTQIRCQVYYQMAQWLIQVPKVVTQGPQRGTLVCGVQCDESEKFQGRRSRRLDC